MIGWRSAGLACASQKLRVCICTGAVAGPMLPNCCISGENCSIGYCTGVCCCGMGTVACIAAICCCCC